MTDPFVSLVEVHFIPISCNFQVSQFIKLTSYTMTFIMLTKILQALDSQTSLINILSRAFNLIKRQWKDQFRETTQWNNFKIFHLKHLESNSKKVNDYIIHSYLYNYNICTQSKKLEQSKIRKYASNMIIKFFLMSIIINYILKECDINLNKPV